MEGSNDVVVFFGRDEPATNESVLLGKLGDQCLVAFFVRLVYEVHFVDQDDDGHGHVGIEGDLAFDVRDPHLS